MIRKGRWALARQGELEYRSEGLDEEIRLKASLVEAEPEALIVAVTEKQSDQKSITHLVRIRGAWSMDTKNRLVFETERSAGRSDTLTFQGTWELNDRQQIVYKHARTALKTRSKIDQTLTFKGYWEIRDGKGLSYVLEGSSDTSFRLRGAFQTQSILAKQGEIRYQLGGEVSGRGRAKTLSLFGKWLVSRDLGLHFELRSPGSHSRALSFGGNYRLNDRDRISADLTSQEGKRLGVELVLTRELFKGDGEAFIRLKRSLEGSRLEAGAAFKF